MTLQPYNEAYDKAIGNTFNDKWLTYAKIQPSHIMAHLIFKGEIECALAAIQGACLNGETPAELQEGSSYWKQTTETFEAHKTNPDRLKAMPFGKSNLKFKIGKYKLGALHLAVIKGRVELVKELIKTTNIDNKIYMDGRRPIMQLFALIELSTTY